MTQLSNAIKYSLDVAAVYLGHYRYTLLTHRCYNFERFQLNQFVLIALPDSYNIQPYLFETGELPIEDESTGSLVSDS